MSLPHTFFAGRAGGAGAVVFVDQHPLNMDVLNATYSGRNVTWSGSGTLGNPYGVYYNPVESRLGIATANSNSGVLYEFITVDPANGQLLSEQSGDSWATGSYTGMTHKFLEGGTKLLSMDYQTSIRLHNVSGNAYDLSSVPDRGTYLSQLPAAPMDDVGNGYGCDLSPDGRFFVSGARATNSEIFCYELTTPFDLSTVANKTTISGAGDRTQMGFHWNSDATQLMIVSGDSTTKFIDKWNLGTPGDLTTAVYEGRLTLNGAQGGNRPTEVAFNPVNKKMYILDNNANGVFEYDLP